jgi:hypothetical protein
MLANINRDPKKRKEPYKTTDFLVKFGERTPEELKPRQTPKEQLSIARMIAGAFNKVEAGKP